MYTLIDANNNEKQASKLADRNHPDYPDLLMCSDDVATAWCLVLPSSDHWVPWCKVEIVVIDRLELLENPIIAKHVQSLTFSIGMTDNYDFLLTYRINSTPKPESIETTFWSNLITGGNIFESKLWWDPMFNLLSLLPPPSEYLEGCFDQTEFYLLA